MAESRDVIQPQLPVPTPAPSPLERLRERLKEFLEANPPSKVEEIQTPRHCFAVTLPWGDDSLAIELPQAADRIIQTLNRLILPERFSAIWHKEKKLLEVIFTAFPLRGRVDFLDRSFTFKYKRKNYECKYGPSSEELLVLGEHYLGISPGTTGHRLLSSFQRYQFAEQGRPGYLKIEGAKPLSFWITGLEAQDELVLDVVNHLNFYMTYYDTNSARIWVHTPERENYAKQPQTRFTAGRFPRVIAARQIDDNLLRLWEASKSGDPARRFLYNYQIIEYSAFGFIEDSVREDIKRILSSPHAADNTEQTTMRVLECIGQSTMHETVKVDMLLKKMVDPALIFRDINLNIEFFSKKIQFEGGFSLDAIAREGWKEADFGVNGMTAFARHLRNIRNALSHGREQKSVSVIAPTSDNLEKLQVWVPLVAVAAAEVMVHRGVN